MTLLAVKSYLDKSKLGYNQTKKGSSSKTTEQETYPKVMQKQSKGIERYTRKIKGTLLHQEYLYFIINNRQIGLKKKKDS